MRNTSLIMLVIALILGTITVMFARSVIQNQRLSATQNTIIEEADVTPVVVALVAMKFGDELTSEQLKVIPWPTDNLPEGSFETIGDIIGTERRVVLRSLGRNEPVVKEKISGFGSRASLSQIITEGRRAAAIRVNDVLSVGGFILPGDRVDVIHTYQNGQARTDFITTIVIEDVRVLGIDQLTDESQEGAIVGKTATLEVTPEQSQKLALGSNVGNLSLSLRRLTKEDESLEADTRVITLEDMKPITKEAVVVEDKSTSTTSYRRPRIVKAEPVNPFGAMKITRGVELSEEQVLREEIATAANTIETNILVGAYPQP